jgi:UbiD family decarboxylase
VIFKDLREWIKVVEESGELARVKGANWEEEIGTITGLHQREMGGPALLFEDIPGVPEGFRVLSNSCSSVRRVAQTLNMPLTYGPVDIIQHWRRFLKEFKPIPPRVVTDGPVLENRMVGDEVDLTIFPSPVWHEDDGGRFIGTGGIVITKDPEDGYVNCGSYRIQVHDEKRAGLLMVPGRHGALMRDKYWKQGKPLPVAISLGHDPLHFLMGGLEVPLGMSEYDYAGAIRGEALDVLESPIHKLPVPATSEIVIEGECYQGDMLPEGPFGEWTGYYASGRKDVPYIRVQAIYYRNNPILLGAVPNPPPCDINYYRTFLRSAMIWDQLEGAGLRGITGVWAHPTGGGRLLHVISIKQLYPGHVKQVGLIASQCQAAAYNNKMVVVVDDDVDIYSTNEVLWAMMTRMDPAKDMEVIERCWTSWVEPTSYPKGSFLYNNRVVIDACKPWEEKDSFPKRIGISKPLADRVMAKFPDLFR